MTLVALLLTGPMFVACQQPWPPAPSTPKPTAAKVAPVAPMAPITNGIDPRTFGARGDGHTDDTAALQRALDSLKPGQTLDLKAGLTFRHTDVLKVTVPNVRLSGGGVLLATNEARSSVWLDADGITVDHLTLRMASTTKRWDAFEQMKLRLAGHSGITVQNVTIDGSAAAGIYVGDQASNFSLIDDTVRNTRADGIHMTGGAHDGTVVRPNVSGAGDDSVAVVSYARDGAPCHDITITAPQSSNNTWGRAFSVVGGTNITYRDVVATGSSSAAVYIATEGAPYYTASTQHISVIGGTLTNSNTNATVDHGAVIVYAGNPGTVVDDVTISGLTISGTRATSAADVNVRSDGGTPEHIQISGLTISGGPSYLFGTSPNVSRTSYRLTDWTADGRAVPNAIGW